MGGLEDRSEDARRSMSMIALIDKREGLLLFFAPPSEDSERNYTFLMPFLFLLIQLTSQLD